MLSLLKRLMQSRPLICLGLVSQPQVRQPEFDPTAGGWYRSDLPEAGQRPVRYRLAVRTRGPGGHGIRPPRSPARSSPCNKEPGHGAISRNTLGSTGQARSQKPPIVKRSVAVCRRSPAIGLTGGAPGAAGS